MKILHLALLVPLALAGLACAGGSTSSNGPRDEVCDNDLDDDGDHMLDCFDPDCFANPICAGGQEICNNSVDDDGDGLADCADADCATHTACITSPENCTNGVDDDRDGLTDCDDPQCASHTACVTTPENCTNGVDDDGDGAADCNDTDCTGNAACTGSGTCTEDNIYVGSSPGNCTGGSQCGIVFQNPNYSPQCRPSSAFAGGVNYGACGTGGACPYGSFCDAAYGCMPYCDAVNATPLYSCPGNGICLFSITTTNNRTVGLCKGIDSCDMVSNNCSGMTCILLVDGTVCVAQTGGLGEGDTCTYADDCGAGLICVGTCLRACYLSSGDPCDWLFETCYQLNDADGNPIPTYGVCDF